MTQSLLPPPALGFEVILSRFTNNGVRLVAANSPILEQADRGYCDRYIRGDIHISTGRTMAVPLPRSSPLTRLPILPPIFVRIPPYAIGVIILGRL